MIASPTTADTLLRERFAARFAHRSSEAGRLRLTFAASPMIRTNGRNRRGARQGTSLGTRDRFGLRTTSGGGARDGPSFGSPDEDACAIRDLAELLYAPVSFNGEVDDEDQNGAGFLHVGVGGTYEL